MTFTSSDRTTLAKVLGMLGSAHDGETLAAARKAHAIVTQRGATWGDVLNLPLQAWPSHPPPPREAEHITLARDLLCRGRGIITAWEKSFLIGIMAYQMPKPRQVEMLQIIRRKLLCEAEAA